MSQYERQSERQNQRQNEPRCEPRCERQKSKVFRLSKRELKNDAGNVESALVLIPLLILFAGIIQLYSFHNIKSAMEIVVQGVAESSVQSQSTVAAQFAAEEYLAKPGLPKFIKTKQLEVTVVDEQFSGFVVRKVFLRNISPLKVIGLSPIQVSSTVILN